MIDRLPPYTYVVRFGFCAVSAPRARIMYTAVIIGAAVLQSPVVVVHTTLGQHDCAAAVYDVCNRRFFYYRMNQSIFISLSASLSGNCIRH